MKEIKINKLAFYEWEKQFYKFECFSISVINI